MLLLTDVHPMAFLRCNKPLHQFDEFLTTYSLAPGNGMYLTPALLGLVELSAVYADDFRAKTMQVAIGIGVSRPRVVPAKLLELILIVMLDLLVGLLIAFATGGILGAGPVGEQYGDILVYLVTGLLQLTCYSSIAMIPMSFPPSQLTLWHTEGRTAFLKKRKVL